MKIQVGGGCRCAGERVTGIPDAQTEGVISGVYTRQSCAMGTFV